MSAKATILPRPHYFPFIPFTTELDCPRHVRVTAGGDRGDDIPHRRLRALKRPSKSKMIGRVRDTAISEVVAEIRWLESAHPSNPDAWVKIKTMSSAR